MTTGNGPDRTTGPGGADSTSLYRRLGGAWAVDVAVELFYRKVLWDERVSRFFDDVDMDRQIAKQVGFLTMAFGGPSTYSGRDLTQAHAHLVQRGMTDHHFDVVLELLADTLRTMGVGEDDVAEVIKIADSVRENVMGRQHW